MSDTHDERGPFRDDLRTQLVTAGTEAAEQWLTVRANRKMSDVNRKRLAGHVVNVLWDEIERAAVEMAQYVGDEQLAAATARAEKAEAEVAGFGPACCVCGRILGYRNYRDQLFCWPCADGEPKTADAAPGGLSGPVERPEASGGSFQANTSSILPQGLSEAEPPRDTSAWCWAPNPNGPLCCERLRDHEPPHRRGERTWTDDTTEDGQHG